MGSSGDEVTQPHIIERRYLGAVADEIGPSRAAKIWKVSKQVAFYWKVKHNNPEYHPKTWGGPRNCAFDPATELLIQYYVKFLLDQNPIQNLKELKRQVIETLGIWVSITWIWRLLSRWGYTHHKAETRNIRKYTGDNIMRWFQFYCWVKTLDPVNVRFVDEVHFEPKSVRRRGGYAPRGHRIISIRDEWIKERYSMILLTDPEGQGYPFAAQLFDDTIDSEKFVIFLLQCIVSGNLKSGNWLILDNAALHFSGDTYETMLAILKGAGVNVMFLPTYSPEFNPCELVFGLIKNYLRNNSTLHNTNFKDEILKALKAVTFNHLAAFYCHCMYEVQLD